MVAFGDSISDGFIADGPLSIPESPSAAGSDSRYPDALQRRAATAGRTLSIVNAGMSGNQFASAGPVPPVGPSGVSRVQKDLLDVAGVRDAIVLQGINDLGLPPYATFEQLTAAYTDVIERAPAAGVRIHLGTILPASNAIPDGLSAPGSNDVRKRVNEWIRTQTLSDSVIDFDGALRDPSNPDILLARYAGVDNLHPNAVGYQAMADVIDLSNLGIDNC